MLLPPSQPASADAVLVKRSATDPAHTTLTVTSMLPRVALEYAHVASCVVSTSPIALMKQADHPAANNCSGLVPVPGTPGAENLTSKRPSSLRETPPRRPPEVCVLAVYRTFMSSCVDPTAIVF